MSPSIDMLLSLQNGSDIRGVALTNDKPVNLTPETVTAIGAAFVRWLAAKLDRSPFELAVGVGHDSRLTARPLTAAFLKGITAEGASGLDCGMASTPAMFMSCVLSQTSFDGGVMLTASHLPKDRNGVKLFTKAGGLDKTEIKAILTDAVNPAPECIGKTVQVADIMSLYCLHLRQKIIDAVKNGLPLMGLHIVVDAGNGAGGFFATEVLAPLGADISGSIFLKPDGNFPNHEPNPENKAAMEAIRQAVLTNHAHMGLIFDTDVDRASAVLADGSIIARDSLIALISALVAVDYPKSTVVTDSVTSDRLTAFLENKLGLHHHRFKRGYKNVIDEAKRLEKEGTTAPLAIETSGHGALSENYYLDDGAYLAVKLVTAAALAKRQGQLLNSLIEDLPPAFEEREYRLKVTSSNFLADGDNALAVFEQRARNRGYAVVTPSFEGVRLTFKYGWLLLRKSLHDPLLPLNLEGVAQGDCKKLVSIVKELLKDLDYLDLTSL